MVSSIETECNMLQYNLPILGNKYSYVLLINRFSRSVERERNESVHLLLNEKSSFYHREKHDVIFYITSLSDYQNGFLTEYRDIY